MFQKYYDKKLFLIPIINGDKFPFTIARGFHEWALDGYDKNYLDAFTRIGKTDCGYALLTGPASGVICVDLDTLLPEIIEAVPHSPVRVIGNKERYGKMFFQYSEGITNTNTKIKIKGQEHGVDFLIERKYAILPPSVHQKGYPYEWADPKYTLDSVAISDLPTINGSDIERIKRLLFDLADSNETSYAGASLTTLYSRTDGTNGRKDPHGAHNQLIKLAHALIAQRLPIDEAVQKLLEFDKTNHIPIGHFSPENKHSDTGADEYSNALHFYSNLLKSNNKRRAREGKEPEVPVFESFEMPTQTAPQRVVLKSFPKVGGLIGSLQEFFIKESPAPQPVFAMGGALGIMSVFCSGRFFWGRSWPNIYLLFSGRTGRGKDSIKSGSIGILTHEKLRYRNLFGLGDYVSAPALVLGLPLQRIRLDVVDEFSSLLSNVSSGNQLKRDAALELTKLWSTGSGYYPGIKSVGRGDQTGGCYSPCISMMGFCQPETLVSSANKDMLDNGFLPRFLIFHVEEKNGFNSDAIFKQPEVESIVSTLCEAFPDKDLLESPGRSKKIEPGALRLTPEELAINPKAKKHFADVAEAIYNGQDDINGDPVALAFETRKAEQIAKIMTLVTVSSGRREIGVSDVDLAHELVDAIHSNSRFLLSEATASGEYAKLFEKLSSYMHKKGAASEREIANRLRGIQLKTRHSLLADLESHGLIKKDPTKRVWFYVSG